MRMNDKEKRANSYLHTEKTASVKTWMEQALQQDSDNIYMNAAQTHFKIAGKLSTLNTDIPGGVQ